MDIFGNSAEVSTGDIVIIEADVSTLEQKTTNQSFAGSTTTFTGTTDLTTGVNVATITSATSITLDTASDIFTTGGIEPLSNGFLLGSTAARWESLYCDNILSNSGFTGVNTGGILTGALGGTVFDISAGTGTINYDTTRSHASVSWSSALNVPILTGGGQLATWVAVDATGAFQYKESPFNADEKRKWIKLGIISHAGGVIDYVAQHKFILDTSNQNMVDLCDSLGIFNISGNVFSGKPGTLNLLKSTGNYFQLGSNSANSITNPNSSLVASQDTPQLNYFTQTFAFSIQPTLNTTQWDNLGTLTTMTNNYWKCDRVFLVGSAVGITYGQDEYKTYADISLDYLNEVNDPPDDPSFLLRAYVFIKKDATDASDPTQVVFIEAGKFGSVQSGGSAGTSAGGNVSSDISTLNAIARYGDTTGTLIKNSTVTIADTGDITTPGTVFVKASGYNNKIEIRDQGNTTQADGIGFLDIGGVVGGTNMIVGYTGDAGYCRVSSYAPTNDLRLSTSVSGGEKKVTLKADGTFEINDNNLDLKTNTIVNVADPVSDQDVATKSYTDGLIGTHTSYAAAALPSAFGFVGKVIYIQDEGKMAFSDGNVWARLTREVAFVWNPTNVPNLQGWYDASNADSMSQSVETIPTWNDISGQGNHLTQVFGAPTTGSLTQNSHNVVDFDGSSCVGSSTVSINYYVHTIIVVCDIDSNRDLYGSTGSGDGHVIMSTSGADPGPLQCVAQRGASSNYNFTGPTTLAAWNILVMRVTATDMDLIANGGTPVSFTMAGTFGGTLHAACIGSRVLAVIGESIMLNGRVGEVLVYDRDVSDTELNTIGNYLGAKWAITWTDLV